MDDVFCFTYSRDSTSTYTHLLKRFIVKSLLALALILWLLQRSLKLSVNNTLWHYTNLMCLMMLGAVLSLVFNKV